jgi:hypothetical protein
MNKIYRTSQARYGQCHSTVMITISTLDSESPVRDTATARDKGLHHSCCTFKADAATGAVHVNAETLSDQLLHLMSRCGANTWLAQCVRETVENPRKFPL